MVDIDLPCSAAIDRSMDYTLRGLDGVGSDLAGVEREVARLCAQLHREEELVIAEGRVGGGHRNGRGGEGVRG